TSRTIPVSATMSIDQANQRPKRTCDLLPPRAVMATIAAIGAIAPARMWRKSIVKKTLFAKTLP
ncbi:hypothetical protein, partial [Allocoleopsis sp.]|uniref:hypothetical protein n=1 Tax=Allocoleopsis sp. TaxID=3088169 RepID=UPI002FCFA5B0